MHFTLLYIMVTLINSIGFMFGMTNLLLFQIRKENQVFITVFLFFLQLLAIPIGQYATILMIGGTLLMVASSNKHYFINSIFSLLGYLMYIFINYIMLFFSEIFGISTSELYDYNYFSLTFVLVYAVLVYITTYYAGKFIRKKFIGIVSLPKIVQALFLTEILCCAAIFVFNIIIADKNDYPAQFITFNLILFGVMISVTLIILFLIIFYIQKNEEILLLQKERTSMEEYAEKTERFYRYASEIKQRYINVFSMAQHYLAEDDREGLNSLFNKEADSEKSNFREEDYLDKLDEIKLLELKSLLYSKLLYAKSINLQISFDIQTEISHISMDILDLTKVMEEILNNAVEAAGESEKKKLKILLLEDDVSVTILVSNSSLKLEHNLVEIYDEGTSSKSSHEGIGLYKVEQTLNKYRNIIHSTNYVDNVFTQTLEICNIAVL